MLHFRSDIIILIIFRHFFRFLSDFNHLFQFFCFKNNLIRIIQGNRKVGDLKRFFLNNILHFLKKLRFFDQQH